MGDEKDPGTANGAFQMDTLQHRSGQNLPWSSAGLTTELSLSLKSNQEAWPWFTAIATDDISFIEDVIQNKPKREQSLFLNGPFDYGDDDFVDIAEKKLGFDMEVAVLMRVPLMVAIRFSSRDILGAILELGGDITISDTHGNNIFHSLILLCYMQPHLEAEMAAMYEHVTILLGPQTCKQLLFGENRDGLRPLELACKKGMLQLVRAIMHTPAVYLVHEEDFGVVTHQKFEITEYETSGLCGMRSRNSKSPLAYLAYMDIDTASKPEAWELLEWCPFKQWQRYKLRSSILWLVLWFLQRLAVSVLLIAFLVNPVNIEQVSGTPNITIVSPQQTCPQSAEPITVKSSVLFAIGIIIVAFSGIGILVDIGELFNSIFCRKSNAKGSLKLGKTVVWYLYPRIIQHLFLYCVILICIRTLTPLVPFGTYDNVVRLLFAMFSANTCLNLMYCVPILGYYINVLMRMLIDLVMIVIIYILMLLPFAVYFNMFFLYNSNQGCVEEYRSIPYSMYTLFMVSFFAADFSEVDVKDRTLLIYTHILFAVIVGILLLNYLIAIMSDTASNLSANRDMIVKLERLHYALITESRLLWIFGGYYSSFRSRYLTVENNRVYLHNAVLSEVYSGEE